MGKLQAAQYIDIIDENSWPELNCDNQYLSSNKVY